MRGILIGTGISFLIVVVGEALVLGFNFFLANSLGPVGTCRFLGAAIAASLCMMAKNVINTCLVRQRLGFFATPLLKV